MEEEDEEDEEEEPRFTPLFLVSFLFFLRPAVFLSFVELFLPCTGSVEVVLSSEFKSLSCVERNQRYEFSLLPCVTPRNGLLLLQPVKLSGNCTTLVSLLSSSN